jgi:flagellin
LLNGDFAGGVFQVGASAGDNITVGSLTNATAEKLSSIKYTQGDLTVAGAAADGAFGAGKVTINGIETTLSAVSSLEERTGQIVAAVNAQSADTGITAFTTDTAGKVTLMSEEGDATAAQKITTITVTLDNTTGTTAPTATVANWAAGANKEGIATMSVKTQADAWVALKKVDQAIDDVNSARGDLGALQTRFEKSIENIDIMNENISAARGRIVDADFASETANLSRAQILQQAGTAMIAQANQLPQNVLSLLR